MFIPRHWAFMPGIYCSNEPQIASKLVDGIKSPSLSLKVMGCLAEQHMTKSLWVLQQFRKDQGDISEDRRLWAEKILLRKHENWNQNLSKSKRDMSKYLGYYMIPEHNYLPIHSSLVIRNALHGAFSFGLWAKSILKTEFSIGAVPHPNPNKPSNLKSLYKDSLCSQTCYKH